MFLSMLNEPQKQAFFALAAHYVAEDGLVERNELGWMDSVKREMGMDQRAKVSHEPLEELLPLFDSRASQVIAMLELIRLGYVDGEHSPAESAFVKKMVQVFDLPEELFHQVDGWASRHAALTRQGVELILGRKCDPAR